MIDKSSKFLQMCKLDELQEIHEWEVGDFLYDKDYNRTGFVYKKVVILDGGYPILHVSWGDGTESDFTATVDSIWLPLPHQLFGMVDFGGNPGWWPKINVLRSFADESWSKSKPFPNHENPYSSLQQLLLAWVAKEKWNKVWDDKEGGWKNG